MIASATDDYELWQSFKKGSMEAFQQIYYDHFHSLFEYGMRLINDKELVKDTVHDLFVKLWNNKTNLGDVKVIRAYLLVSMRGSVFNNLSREKKIIPAEISDKLHFEMIFSVEHELIRKESVSIKTKSVINALNELSPRQKEILYLRFYQEMTYEEVSEILNISVKATYKLNARALEALRKILTTSIMILFIVSDIVFIIIHFMSVAIFPFLQIVKCL